MDKAARCLEILKMLQEKGIVKVNELSAKFDTSEMTIRRDLKFLSQQYNLQRTHGGAIMPQGQPVVRIISFDEQRIKNKEAKEKIALKAASLIRFRQRIFIDAGSTTRQIVNYIDSSLHNIIVTNHLQTAEAALKIEYLSVIMLGGEIIGITNCSSGEVAEEQLRKYQLDIAFLGAAAIGNDGMIYDGYSPEARFKKSVFEVAKETYLLADSTKFNTYDLNSFASLDQVKAVITDSNINSEGLALLKKFNVQIIIAE